MNSKTCMFITKSSHHSIAEALLGSIMIELKLKNNNSHFFLINESINEVSPAV